MGGIVDKLATLRSSSSSVFSEVYFCTSRKDWWGSPSPCVYPNPTQNKYDFKETRLLPICNEYPLGRVSSGSSTLEKNVFHHWE